MIKNKNIFLFVLISNLILVPWFPGLPSSGLDPSWISVISNDFVHKAQWGKDIIFTYGPLGIIQVKHYFKDYFSLTIPIWIFITTINSIILWSMSNKLSFSYKILFLGIYLFCYPLMGDSFYLFSSSITVIYLMNRDRNIWAISVCTLLLSLFPMMKTTFLLYSLGCIVILAFFYIYNKLFNKMLVLVVTFLAWYFCIYFLSGQNFISFPFYIINSLQILIGYTPSMSIQGNQLELIIFFALSVVLLFLFISSILKFKQPNINKILFISLAFAFLFVSFKQGFVRHDLHSLTAWSALCLFGGLIIIISSYQRKYNHIFAICLTLIASFMLVNVFSTGVGISKKYYITNTLINGYWENLFNAKKFILNNESYRNSIIEDVNEKNKKLAEQSPVHSLQGTVDSIPNIQSSIIASNLEYKHRPIIQEYSTYTPLLQKINIKFFEDNGPDYILLKTGSIDNRQPMLAEGSSYPTFFKRYQIVNLIDDTLLLHRLPKETESIKSDRFYSNNVKNDELVNIDQGSWVFAKIKFNYSFWGKLLNSIFKLPAVNIEYNFLSKKEQYRLIPGITETGFYINPVIKTMDNFLFNIIKPCSVNSCAKSFSIDTGGSWTSILYKSIEVNLYKHSLPRHVIDNDFLLDITNNKLPSWLESEEKINFFNKLASTTNVKSPFVIASDKYLFAHAPVTFTMPESDIVSNKLFVEFGLRQGAFPITRGVCFSLSNQDGNIWKHCITDGSSKKMVTSTAHIKIPVNSKFINFTTSCVDKNCNNAWSLWKNIKFVK